jgi:hypothetical protein
MGKLNITKEELLNKYNEAINEIADECDWITYIDGQMVCATVVSILLENNVNRLIHSDKLNELYDKHIKSLKLKKGEWEEKYGVPEIIDIIYGILEKNAE